jgi:hypothetical protein
MSNKKKAQEFWAWFMTKECRYLYFGDVEEEEADEMVDELATRLSTYRKGLGFQLHVDDDHTGTLTITASGNFSLLDDVMLLIELAPALDNWEFLDFIRVGEVEGAYVYHDVILFMDDIYFAARKNNRRFGLLDLTLYVKPLSRFGDSENFETAVKMMLLVLLGEAYYATTIGTLTIREFPSSIRGKRLCELSELPAYIIAHNVIKRLAPVMRRQGIDI